jgi:hypothetical protein
MLAVAANRLEVVNVLLRAGANRNAKNLAGATSLQLARTHCGYRNCAGVIQALELGPNP